MRPDSSFYRLNASHDCVANVYSIKKEPLPGTNGETVLPKAGLLHVRFHVEEPVQRWPALFIGDDFMIKFFSIPLAEKVCAAGLTGIEFQPVQLELGNLRTLKRKTHLCPGYVWARVTGILLVDVFVNKVRAPTDPTGMFLLQRKAVGSVLDMYIRDAQPYAGDFCRVVPGGTGYLAISRKAADFFDKLKLPELQISTVGGGYL